MRVQPFFYIDGLRHDWGQTAYLIVQMVGIQGFMQAVIVNLSFWAVGISLINARNHQFPRVLLLLGVFPAFQLFAGLFGAFLGVAFDNLFMFYVLSRLATVL